MWPLDRVIDIRRVRKHFSRGSCVIQVLENIDFQVRRGEFVFLVGPSGSGKSTLLSIIGAMLTPDAGQVRLLGCDLLSLNQRARTELRRDRIGFVFQRFHLIRGLTALDNVCVPLTLCNWSRRRAESRAQSLLHSVGLADHASAMPQTLSAGQCQRVAIARALAADPDLILADEPTASLDAVNGQSIMELLRDLTEEMGKTAVVVTHDQRILHFADRVCLIDNGRLLQKPRRREPIAAMPPKVLR
jgi:putative ABC transport system ATP-binding protein